MPQDAVGGTKGGGFFRERIGQLTKFFGFQPGSLGKSLGCFPSRGGTGSLRREELQRLPASRGPSRPAAGRLDRAVAERPHFQGLQRGPGVATELRRRLPRRQHFCDPRVERLGLPRQLRLHLKAAEKRLGRTPGAGGLRAAFERDDEREVNLRPGFLGPMAQQSFADGAARLSPRRNEETEK